MKTLFFFAFAIALTITTNARSNNNTAFTYSTLKQILTDHKWNIKNQSFASHDVSGTDLDTVQANEGDYISFQDNGKAYCYFKGTHDTLEYKIIGTDSISFGDTPFQITFNQDHVEFYQNEEEKNGDYNRVTYTLVSERKEALKTITKK
jgi:hypothetical protein